MSTGLYRAERRRDLADECIAALCTPSTEKQTRDWRMAEHYSKLPKAGPTGVGRFEDSGPNGWRFIRSSFHTVIGLSA